MIVRVLEGDCRDAMLGIAPGSVDAVVTDPPYGLEFMGRGWDHGVPGRSYFRAMYEAAKPGAHLFAFGGTRLYHRMACAIEDAGWEVRDTLSWMYGSGFPKSLDVSKAIDSAAGARRLKVGRREGLNPKTTRLGFAGDHYNDRREGDSKTKQFDVTLAATPLARRFEGYGTALKPAWEPIILARKPLDGTVAANVQAHGTGALNIDGGRVGGEGATTCGDGGGRPSLSGASTTGHSVETLNKGRWPANVVLDEEAAAMLDEGQPKTRSPKSRERAPDPAAGSTWNLKRTGGTQVGHGDSGGPSRFFYCAKASKRDRRYTDPETGEEAFSDHPTVKPIALMRWLVRLALPPGGDAVVLDPFMGSGSTGVACALEGAGTFIGCERVEHFRQIAEARIREAL